MPKPASTRVIPTKNQPGPITELTQAGPLPGESGKDALARIGDTVLPPELKTKRKISRQLAAVLACRAEGMRDKEIAAALGISVPAVRKVLYKARRDNGLDDLASQVKDRAIPSAMENVIDAIEEGDLKQSKYLLDRTIFKKQTADKDGGASNQLRVVIEMPTLPDGSVPQVAVGAIVGKPQQREIAAPVVEAETV